MMLDAGVRTPMKKCCQSISQNIANKFLSHSVAYFTSGECEDKNMAYKDLKFSHLFNHGELLKQRYLPQIAQRQL